MSHVSRLDSDWRACVTSAMNPEAGEPTWTKEARALRESLVQPTAAVENGPPATSTTRTPHHALAARLCVVRFVAADFAQQP